MDCVNRFIRTSQGFWINGLDDQEPCEVRIMRDEVHPVKIV